jgi:hypothetical protein
LFFPTHPLSTFVLALRLKSELDQVQFHCLCLSNYYEEKSIHVRSHMLAPFIRVKHNIISCGVIFFYYKYKWSLLITIIIHELDLNAREFGINNISAGQPEKNASPTRKGPLTLLRLHENEVDLLQLKMSRHWELGSFS